ncbi:fungal-specific transcription factor domain-containing protein [Cunninghamella echinulata]|nr:fungal-specific transcription factor domain-containing protein [Cunninghamella echinulata]
MDGEQPQKRQRVSKACEQCRSKKTKCDGITPACGICTSQNLECTYKAVSKKRGPPKGYIEAIEGRLHRLEALIGSIIQEDDPRFQAIITELHAPLQTSSGEFIRRKTNSDGTTTIDNTGSEADQQQQPRILPSSSNINHAHQSYQDKKVMIPNQHQSNQDNYTLNNSNSSQNDRDSPDGNDNLGNLSVDESGQLRYYGKSSGFYMLKNSQNFKNGAFHFSNRGYQTENNANSIQQLIDPFELPQPDLAKSLLELYFTHFYTLIPIIHKDAFWAKYQNNDNPPSKLLLNAMFAVASRISSDVRVRLSPELPNTAGDIFFERARILLDFEYDDFTISTIQALLLMSSHQNGALKSIRGWIYSGMAFRMSQNLGLHRNCDTWDLTQIEKEERKRVYYGCFVIDRLSCAMHGRSPIIDERDCDAPYPQENDKCEVGCKTDKIMDHYHPLIKLCEILGDVLREVYTVKGRQQLKRMPSPDTVISRLDKALNSWMAKLPMIAKYRPPNSRIAEEGPVPSLALCQIHMLYYTTLILLHRPFIPGPKQTISPSVFPSREICTYGANKILDIVVSLMKDNLLTKVNNYTLYFMFTAGIIFINDASSSDTLQAFESKISINKIIHAMDTVETTWITSARHSNIIGELAGLRDINLETVDENYKKQLQEKQKLKQRPQPSIVVPNSPILDPRHNNINNSNTNSMDTSSSSPSIKDDRSISDSPSTSSILFDKPTLEASASIDTERPFDPLGTAFFGVPASFDVNEWNYYLNRINNEQQQ